MAFSWCVKSRRWGETYQPMLATMRTASAIRLPETSLRAGAGFRVIAIERLIVVSLRFRLLRGGLWAGPYKSSNE
jgi:hypothetical protein